MELAIERPTLVNSEMNLMLVAIQSKEAFGYSDQIIYVTLTVEIRV